MNRRELLKGMTAAAVAGIFGHRLASEVPWFKRGSGLIVRGDGSIETSYGLIEQSGGMVTLYGVDQYNRRVEMQIPHALLMRRGIVGPSQVIPQRAVDLQFHRNELIIA